VLTAHSPGDNDQIVFRLGVEEPDCDHDLSQSGTLELPSEHRHLLLLLIFQRSTRCACPGLGRWLATRPTLSLCRQAALLNRSENGIAVFVDDDLCSPQDEKATALTHGSVIDVGGLHLVVQIYAAA
jgi:hypothetical protein